MKSLLAATLLAVVAAPPLLAQQRPGAPGTAPASAAAASGASTASPAPVCPTCGVVASVRPVTLRSEPQWVGTIGATPRASAPSVAIGAGRSPTLPGRDTDAAPRRRTVYEVVVQMDDQSTQKLHYEHRPALSAGDRVRVSDGQVYLR